MIGDAKNILCPIEFDESFLNVLMLSKQLVQRNAGTLYLMHVVPEGDPLVIGSAAKPHHDEVLAEQELKRVIQEHLSDVPARIVLRVGDAAEEIIKAEREFGIDLVVMPTHANTGVFHLLTNRVADHVIHGSFCPVLALSENAWPQV
jgi:glycine betaine transporter